MVTPTLKRATDATPGGEAKYGAQDIVKLVDVLTAGPLAGSERIQVENIEQVTNPWTYYVYIDSTGTTVARRGDTNRAEFSDASNPRTVIQNALDTAYAAYSRCVIFLAPQTFTAPIPTGSNPPVDGSTSGLISVGTHGGRTLKNNISIIGAGMDRTVLQNFSIQKEVTQFSQNVTVQDLTVDAGAVSNLDKSLAFASQPAPNDTLGYGIAVSFSAYSKNFRLLRVRAQNSRDFCLHYGAQIGSLFENCVISDGGLGGSRDTAAGGGAYFTDQTESTRNQDWLVVRNNTFIKDKSYGGGMMTTGKTGKLLIIGNQYLNYDTNCYQGISIENDSDYGPNDETRIMFNKGYGPRQGCQVGNNATGSDFVGDRCIIHGNIFEGALRARKVKDVIISDNIIQNSMGEGINVSQAERAIVHHNLVRNTNVGSPNTGSPTASGCYINNCGYVSIDHLYVYDDGDSGSTDPRVSTPINPKIAVGTVTTPSGLFVSGRGTSAGGIAMIDNVNLLGDVRASPASPFWAVLTDTTNTGLPLRVHSTQEVIIRGGRINGPTTNIFGTGGSANGTIDSRDLVGYNDTFAAVTMTPPANGASYTNTDGVPEVLYIYGGVLTGSGITKSSVSLSGTTTPLQVWLDPGDTIGFNYSSAPTVVKWRH